MILHQSFNPKVKDTTSKLGKNSLFFIKITASLFLIKFGSALF